MNELISVIVTSFHHSNALNSNIYVLAEFCMLAWLFRRVWGRIPVWVWLAWPAGVAVWIADSFFLHSITGFSWLFRVFYSIVILLYSIHLASGMVSSGEGLLKDNPRFLIAFIFVLYYSGNAFVMGLLAINAPLSHGFYVRVTMINEILNLICNLAFCLALRLIPAREAFRMDF